MSKQQDNKHVDKFGYASVMVGDSAALFSRHMDEYSTSYGEAARNIGQSFAGADGSVSQTMLAGQRFLHAASACLPLGLVGSVVTVSTNLLVAAAQFQQASHTCHMEKSCQGLLAVRKAEHILHLSNPEAVASLIRIACHYGREEQANAVHLVVADSYQAAQLRLLLLQQKEETNYKDTNPEIAVEVFGTLQEAFDAAPAVSSSSCEMENQQQATTSRGSSGKVLIYFHTLEPIQLPQDLHIQNCPDFVLRSDAGQAGLQPRLALTGVLKISNSSGTIQSVAFYGGVPPDNLDKDSHVEFFNCISRKNARSFSDPATDKDRHSATRLKKTVGFLLLATPLVAVGCTIFLGRRGHNTRN